MPGKKFDKVYQKQKLRKTRTNKFSCNLPNFDLDRKNRKKRGNPNQLKAHVLYPITMYV